MPATDLHKVGIPSKIIPAIRVLYEGAAYAAQTSGDTWEFSVELDVLTTDLSNNDLRWLVRKGIVEHRREVTIEGDDGRAFRTSGDMTFECDTCFILTDCGIAIAHELFCDETDRIAGFSLVRSGSTCFSSGEGSHDQDSRKQTSPRRIGGQPQWNAEHRVLTVDGELVKRYTRPALNQELILAAFHEDGWPARITDPLRSRPEQNSKRRLNDAIKCLNRKQQNQLLTFRGDGTGTGVIWGFVKTNES